jgi:hypothetical protein
MAIIEIRSEHSKANVVTLTPDPADDSEGGYVMECAKGPWCNWPDDLTEVVPAADALDRATAHVDRHDK